MLPNLGHGISPFTRRIRSQLWTLLTTNLSVRVELFDYRMIFTAMLSDVCCSGCALYAHV